GGTWFENIYPGVRCDIPALVYQSTFASNNKWTEEFARGAEIRNYWQNLARKYDVYRFLKAGRRVEKLEWDDAGSLWHVTVRDVKSSEISHETADFVVKAIGRFNAWRLPQIPGIEDYQGLVRHTSNWDANFEAADKNVAVIGNGASGIQVVPELQKVARHVDHYARSKTWIASSFGGDERTTSPKALDPEIFRSQEALLEARKKVEGKYWRRFHSQIRGSEANNQLREDIIQLMTKRLQRKPELIENLLPDFSPNCRRLTPGPGYLEALCAENVDYIQTPIKRFTARGLETVDGKVREVDAVFCATGANTDLVPPFPILSRGLDLQEAWKPSGKFGFPYTYLGLATPGFPNLLFIGTAHLNGASGTLPHGVEIQITYYANLLRNASSQHIKAMEPLPEAANDFLAYSDAFFATTVLTDNCSSWANGGRPGGRVHGLWPGSAAHCTLVRREPRWEDWKYEYHAKSGNRFAYFGNGWTEREQDPEADMTAYLKLEEDNDLRYIHEEWCDL
ncbi:MAG: hypothetical protein Q9191_008416, partial [Dirinaria sp. TL-2023a]